MNEDMESVWLNFTWKFSVLLNAITFTQSNSVMDANKQGHSNSGHFCFSHCI